MTIIDRYLDHLEHRRRLSPNTVKLRRTYVKQLAEAVDLLEATASELNALLASHSEDWTPATANVMIATMRSFYSWALDEELISVDPARRIEAYPIPKRKSRIATIDHIRAGLNSEDLYARLFARLGAECGLRVHEIAKLHTDDREDDWLRIVGKGSVERFVHLEPELLADLEQAESLQGRGYYFRSPKSEHLVVDSVRYRITRVMGTNPHSLRHYAGTNVYHGTGKDLRLTQVFLGHAKPQTTALYVHIERDELRAASAAARLAA